MIEKLLKDSRLEWGSALPPGCHPVAGSLSTATVAARDFYFSFQKMQSAIDFTAIITWR
jgi:hypothetical protein